MTLYSGRSSKPPPEKLIKTHNVIPEEVSLACQMDLKKESGLSNYGMTLSRNAYGDEKTRDNLGAERSRGTAHPPSESVSPRLREAGDDDLARPTGSILIQDNRGPSIGCAADDDRKDAASGSKLLRKI